MFCRKCGANIPEDSQFCLKCGVGVIPPPNSATPSGTAPVAAPARDALPEVRLDAPTVKLEAPTIKAEKTASGQSGRRILFVIGLLALLLGALHDFSHYGFFGPAFDPLLWLLGITLFLLYRRSTSLRSKKQATSDGKAEVVQEPKPVRAAASRWARLGIFLGMALASAILAAHVFVKGNSTFVENLTEKLTTASLQLGLVAWAVGEVMAGRWLTLKRTWVAAIGLYSIAFLLVAIFMGKPLATKLAELNEEQAQLDRRFAESATGKSLLQPQSFTSPQAAATSLTEFEQYADATERLNTRKEALLLQRDDPSFRDRWASYFEATRTAASTTEGLYRFAAEPSRQVHVENGVVVIADADEYNKRMDSVSDAMEKLRLATSALGESVPNATEHFSYNKRTMENFSRTGCEEEKSELAYIAEEKDSVLSFSVPGEDIINQPPVIGQPLSYEGRRNFQPFNQPPKEYRLVDKGIGGNKAHPLWYFADGSSMPLDEFVEHTKNNIANCE